MRNLEVRKVTVRTQSLPSEAQCSRTDVLSVSKGAALSERGPPEQSCPRRIAHRGNGDDMFQPIQAPPNDYAIRALACMILGVFIASFFWIYDVIAHREAPYVPVLNHGTSGARTTTAPLATRITAPVAEINSLTTEFHTKTIEPIRASSKTTTGPKKQHAERAPRQMTRPYGRDAFAQEFSPDRNFGGF
jgi:hypothetical protein